MTSPLLQSLVRCPKCRTQPVDFTECDASCSGCGAHYPYRQDTPVLIRDDNEVFPVSEFTKPQSEATGNKRNGWLARLIPSPSVNMVYRQNLDLLGQSVSHFEKALVLVVGSGQQKPWLEELMSRYANIHLVYTDIDTSAVVDFYCDGHDLPFVDDAFQGVIATAVLEHVMYPEKVAQEMHRVVQAGGVVYTEIPFMQQVHEGAYDFTRFTLSGHRRLFNGFDEIKSGLVAGPATALVWSIERLALCFAGRRGILKSLAKLTVRLLFGWIKYLDYLLKDSPQAADSASCTYFLGRKRESGKVSDREIISSYTGAGDLQHT